MSFNRKKMSLPLLLPRSSTALCSTIPLPLAPGRRMNGMAKTRFSARLLHQSNTAILASEPNPGPFTLSSEAAPFAWLWSFSMNFLFLQCGKNLPFLLLLRELLTKKLVGFVFRFAEVRVFVRKKRAKETTEVQEHELKPERAKKVPFDAFPFCTSKKDSDFIWFMFYLIWSFLECVCTCGENYSHFSVHLFWDVFST